MNKTHWNTVIVNDALRIKFQLRELLMNRMILLKAYQSQNN